MRTNNKISAMMLAMIVLCRSLTSGAQNLTSPRTGADLTLADLVKRVLQHNEEVQVKFMDFAASQSKAKSEYGVFEPQAYATINDQVDNRQNSSIQAAALLSQPYYFATNITYETGVESTLLTGTRLRVGYTLSDIHDNIQPVSGFKDGEYQTFFGVSATQPLLRNFDPAVNLAPVRIAALSSKIAFQEYRRQLMTVLSSAEASYWNLYLAQEEVRYFEDSVKTAGVIVDDFRTRLQAGTGAQLDVFEAQSGLALRQAKLNEAHQKRIEAANQVAAFYAGRPNSRSISVHAADVPNPVVKELSYDQMGATALQLNPDYLIQVQKTAQEEVRLGYARNQRLPELNLKGSYGLNGLAGTSGQSWDAMAHDNLSSWNVGLEFRLPLGGDIKSRNLFHAAELQVRSAEMACSSIHSQLLNGLDTAWHKLDTAKNSINDYQTTVKYTQTLLDSALTRLKAGQIESGKVLVVEGDLLESRSNLAESLARYELAYIELEVLQGALLRDHNVEITQQSLQTATRALISGGVLTAEKYDRARAHLQYLYDDAEPSAAVSPSTNALPASSSFSSPSSNP